MDDFDQQLEALNIEVCSQLLSVIPEKWDAIKLTVERSIEKLIGIPNTNPDVHFGVYVSSPEKYRDIVAAPDQIHDTVFAMSELLDRKQKWSTIEFTVTYSYEIENWKYVVDYSYEQDVLSHP